jgi:hypothetical protein
MTKASEKTALRDWNKLDSKYGTEAFVLAVMLNMCKVDRNQPAVPVNTNLLELYETASSLELKADPWILFLYCHSRHARHANAHHGASVAVYSSTASIEERRQ